MAAKDSPSPPPAATPEASASAQPAAPAKKRVLCEGKMKLPGRAFPKSDVSHAQAPGATELPDELTPGKGWTWVNFWAAWCVPCKEEIPRLLSWKKKLTEAGEKFDLVFVSLDDDTRQLDQFLASQPASGLKSTYWLKEGEQREKWRGALDLETDPELPQHLLVDPRGQVRCVISGAVEDSDYARVLELVGGS